MKVKSSIIEDVEYESATGELHITFLNGRSYTYKKVPLVTYAKLMAAERPGLFFNQYIKNIFKYEEKSHAKNQNKKSRALQKHR